ncbi:MAG: serine hydrolase [Bacteroidetes bacterium]|nr:serine hydrolase [Bacteroidota bacterium]
MRKNRIITTLFFVSISVGIFAQKSLPTATPESQGVSSQAIIDFLDAVPGSGNEYHSIMVLRHGKIIAQGWWNPYRSDLKHTMYSVSKSFTATAVGFAISEKKLSLDDKVISFFPKSEIPDTVSPYLASLRVRDLLSMSVGMPMDPTGDVIKNEDWIKAFLNTPIKFEPGTKFLYNSAGTFMLSAIVQKVTGEKILDYLKPRLFDPLGIEGIDWETNLQGINTGGWGLRLKTEDMAKFGQLFLQKGMWKGKQILPQEWVDAASTKKIDQDPSAPQAKKDSSDWLQGYCYQMWRSRNNSYRGDGAFGQYILILPEQDAVIIATAETKNMQSEINLIWKYLLPAFQPKALPADAKTLATLNHKIAALSLPIATAGNSSMESVISGKKYAVDSGSVKIRNMSFEFKDGNCYFTLKNDIATYTLGFGEGKWVKGVTTKPGPYLVATAKGNRVGLDPYEIAGSYSWKDDKTLELDLRYVESPHTEIIKCVFDQGVTYVHFKNSYDNSDEVYKIVLAGN